MSEKEFDVTAEEVIEVIRSPIVMALEGEKITARMLAKKLKAELNAKETKAFKGSVKHFSPEGFVESQQDTVIYSQPMTAWEIRQKARQDAHKLRGDYPPERREVSGINGEPIKTETAVSLGPGLRKVVEDLAWAGTRAAVRSPKKPKQD